MGTFPCFSIVHLSPGITDSGWYPGAIELYDQDRYTETFKVFILPVLDPRHGSSETQEDKHFTLTVSHNVPPAAATTTSTLYIIHTSVPLPYHSIVFPDEAEWPATVKRLPARRPSSPSTLPSELSGLFSRSIHYHRLRHKYHDLHGFVSLDDSWS